MTLHYGKRERMEILLDALRDSIEFREKITDQLMALGIEINMELLQNDPAFDASLRIARMYIKDEKLLRWWLYESSVDNEFIDETGESWFLDSASDLIEYYKTHIKI